jgi:hypothetical protein
MTIPPPAADETTRGHVIWHSSDEDSGPDVGLSLGLGNGMMLWLGEMSNRALEEAEIDLSRYSDGWWLTLYQPGKTTIIGAVPDSYEARDAFDEIAAVVRSAAGQSITSPQDTRPTPSGDGLVEALPRRLPDAVIEACAEAHFGKRRARAAGGARGIAMTVAGRDYSWRDMMGHIWPVIRQALAHHTPVCRDSEEGGWRPIETAPRDGTAVLLWFPKRYQGNGGLSWGCFIGGDCLDSRAIRDNDASHWMPMPAAPPKDPDHV